MNPMNPWKIATVALLIIGVTALSTGVTTAYFMRSDTVSTPPTAPTATVASGAARALPAPSVAPAVQYVAARPAPRPAVAPRVVRASTVPVADCDSTGDRVWRIAKPGAVGGLLGAALGAAGGAIADGGKAAGKGALIGGLAGAVLGGGYGAYKTKSECGTVFGGASAGTPAPVYAAR
jgi:hypothetical protein